MSPIEHPRPSDGFVHAHESATGSTPVATGTPSRTNVRTRSSIFAMTATLSPSTGSASAQCATSGYDFHVRIHVSTSLNGRNAASLALAMIPRPHVPLSAGNVSVDTVPHGESRPVMTGGISPSAARKWRAEYTKPPSLGAPPGGGGPPAPRNARRRGPPPLGSPTRTPAR